MQLAGHQRTPRLQDEKRMHCSVQSDGRYELEIAEAYSLVCS